MEIHCIRHTSVALPKGICYGQLDVDLSTTFLQEFSLIHFDTVYDAIYSSPLKRCKLLARHFFEKIILSDALKEISYGDWEGRTWNDITPAEYESWGNDYINVAPPNGECFIDLQGRVAQFLLQLKKDNYQKVLLITHAGVIKTIAAIVENRTIQEALKMPVAYGQFVKFYW